MTSRLPLAALVTAAVLSTHAAPIEGETFVHLDKVFKADGPKKGAPAPDFTLERARGGTIQASKLWAQKPLIVTTGSYTCPQFRDVTPARIDLVKEFGDKVNFVVIYTAEAHPKNSPSPYFGREVVTRENEDEGILIPQPKDYEGRLSLAKLCRQKLGLRSFVAIDKMDNAVWKAYGSSPNCAYLIDTQGKVVFRQGLFDAKTMRAEIEKLLAK